MKANLSRVLGLLLTVCPLLLSSVPLNAGPCTAPPAGMIAWWPGDGQFIGLVGTNHGVSKGQVGFVAGKVGQAFDFNGVDRLVEAAPVLTNAAAFTFEWWLNLRSFTHPDYTPVFGQHCESQSEECIKGAFWFYSGNETQYGSFRFTCVWRDGTLADLHPAIPFGTGTWEHIAVTYDGSLLKLYWNGSLLAEEVHMGKTLGNPSPFWLGHAFVPHTDGQHERTYLDGQIDDFAVYGRALEAREIAALHASGSAGKALPPILAASLVTEGVLLSWPANVDDCSLVSRPDVAAGNWEPVAPEPSLKGDRKEVLVPADMSSQRFFRLTPALRGWVLINSNGPAGGGIAAYDSDRHVAVMFACVGSYPSDTWEFDGTTWRQVAVAGPHGRDASGKMVYDPPNKRMLMQGGWWPDNNDPWTWEYRVTGPGPDDRKWVNIVQADCAYRGAPGLAYDGKRNTALSFGGNHWQSFYNDTWRFDGSSDTWTWLLNWGPSRFAAGLVYDSVRDKFVMFGGTGRWWSGDTEQGRGNTCEFDPKTDAWTEILPQGAPGTPGPRWFPAMVFDPAAGVTMLKGGGRNSDSHTYTDTWEWNGIVWTEIPTRPGEPTGGVLWFDATLRKIVLFSAPNTYVYHR